LGLGARHRSGTGRRPRPRAPRGEVAGLAVRKAAAAILRQVVERGVPLDALLDDSRGVARFRALDARDRALGRAIVGTALRRRGEIEAAISARLDRPLPEGSGDLAAILAVGAAQILFLDVPDHAAVHLAAADAGSDRRTGRARGLVNGVLRRIARERSQILAAADAARANTPPWLFSRWSAVYGEATAAAIAEAHLTQPGLDLTMRDGGGESWAERLGGALLPTGAVRLAEARRVSALPGYEEGAWWVQDAAAAFPARLFGDPKGKAVADLCAAPGGKTAQLAAAGASVTAVDFSESRLKRLGQNLERLRLSARLETADVLDWAPAEKFDGVLLDAPCSATGTIRRHPDVGWLKRPEDIAALAELQAKMLDRAAHVVKPGGRLVYATCSLEPEEGEAQAAAFLARRDDFSLDPIEPAEIAGLAHLLTPAGTLRTLPCHSFDAAEKLRGMDGFFAARFRRT
jgi:16S rRNA (cytosine967-C5)-methyltransferase